MATKKSVHTHVPTKWGFIVLGVMMVGMLFAVTQINQLQSLSSHASYPTPVPTRVPTRIPTPPYSKCVSILHGTCKWTTQGCSKRWATGYCPGPTNYKCCY